MWTVQLHPERFDGATLPRVLKCDMNQPLAWYVRVGITLSLTLLAALPIVHFVFPVLIQWVDSRDWSIYGLLPGGVEYAVRVAFDMIVLSCVPMLTCTGTYHFLSFRRFRRGETYCGRCHGLLRNLTEPRCPECGRPI